MGHSEAVHASRYLAEEQAEHKLANLLQRRARDEGRSVTTQAVEPVIREVTRLPEGVTPELIELARKLRVAGLG
jgi:hypothetical protein